MRMFPCFRCFFLVLSFQRKIRFPLTFLIGGHFFSLLSTSGHISLLYSMLLHYVDAHYVPIGGPILHLLS
jgi:hypothetical protein